VTELNPLLTDLECNGKVPRITAFNRIDGPGSSLDLREFQEAFWRLPHGPVPQEKEELATWSKGLPRTVGITIDIGSVVEAHPHPTGRIGILSRDYGYEQDLEAGHVPYRKELWLLKIADAFQLSGVRFEIHNLIPGITSSGLGGSASATTAVCLLANKLAKAGFSAEQLVAMASLYEQDMGVSITGTQEQSNVVFGGVTDYVWFPWGLPGVGGAYGTSIRRTLLYESDYHELARRLRIYHSGTKRASTDVNSVWRNRLSDSSGFELHLSNLGVAYDFSEGIRHQDWDRVRDSIGQYSRTRIKLCKDYMTGECWDIQGQCEHHGAESFPLGAGGGGALLIFSPSPERLLELDEVLSPVYRRIKFNLKSCGHEFENIPNGY
jgi:D-glycero-alpha-D-manno-heptose-7-phosphate kinase